MSVFGTLREQVPIEHVLATNGGGKVQCVDPDHQDANPSMHLYGDHVHCYGCGFHGDVVDVWGVQKGIDRPIEAALDLAREFNVRLPEMSEEARQKAQEHRQKQTDDLKLAQICHDALEKHSGVAVREWWEGRGFGGEVRERFLLGTNKDGTEAVIPFWHRGRVQGLIRRKLEGQPKYILPTAEDSPKGIGPSSFPVQQPVRSSWSKVTLTPWRWPLAVGKLSR
jgi:DNA primase